jgi:hypothetical protein
VLGFFKIGSLEQFARLALNLPSPASPAHGLSLSELVCVWRGVIGGSVGENRR